MMHCSPHVRASNSHVHRAAAALLALVAATAVTGAKAALYTVGGDGCDFTTIQAALDTAAATIDDDEIRVARSVENGYYADVALVANDPDRVQGSAGALRLVGGYDDCVDTSPSGWTELVGGAVEDASVLRIAGGHVEIQGLRFSGAGPGAFGGGIKYGGAGRLVLRDVWIDGNEGVWGGGLAVFGHGGGVEVLIEHSEISGNRAEFGGAISISPVDAPVQVRIADDVLISNNYASLGGGAIAMHRGAVLLMDGDGLLVDANSTAVDGGAILGVAPVTMHLGAGTFTRNSAINGGAIALDDGWGGFGISDGRASVTIVSDDPAHPLVMSRNHANERGGAIWIDRLPWGLVIDDQSEVCAWNAAFAENDAGLGGSAIALSGSLATFRNADSCAAAAPTCTADACNRISGHVGTIAGGALASSVYEMTGGAHLSLQGTRIVGNATDVIFRASSTIAVAASAVDVYQALVAGNTGASILGLCDEGCDFEMRSSTIAGNTLSTSVFENATNAFAFGDSIVGQPGDVLFSAEPAQGLVVNVLYDAIYAGDAPTLWPGTASFMNATAGDYRLATDSAGIDALPPAGGTDLRGRARDVDLPGLGNTGDIRDLGAYETQIDETGDVLFLDGFNGPLPGR